MREEDEEVDGNGDSGESPKKRRATERACCFAGYLLLSGDS